MAFGGEICHPSSAMNRFLLPVVFLTFPTVASYAVDFKKDVAPVFKTYCYKCHSEAEKKEKGKLVLDNLKRLGEKKDGKVIKAGDPAKSSMYTRLALAKDDDDVMPPAKEKPMSEAEINIVKQWIAEGANFEGGGSPAPAVAEATPPPAGGGMADAGMGGAAPAAGGAQTWTSADGAHSFTGTKLRLEGDNVVLQRADGMCFLVPLSKLNADSQAQAKK